MYFAHWKLRRIFMPKKENVISSNQKWRSPRKTQSWQFAIMSLPIKELKRRNCVNQGSFLRKNLCPYLPQSLAWWRCALFSWNGPARCAWLPFEPSISTLWVIEQSAFFLYHLLHSKFIWKFSKNQMAPLDHLRKIKNLSLNTNPSWRKEWR